MALRAVMTELVQLPDVVEHVLHMLWQTDTRYRAPYDAAHPLVGGFVPDATVTTAESAQPLVALLHPARWLAIETRATFDQRVDRLGARRIVASSIVGAGAVTALLVRPDGYVAWAGESGTEAALAATIDAWT